MKNKKVISFEEYKCKKDKLEIEQEEILILIKKVIDTMKKENKNILNI